ncbi:hypothetical protein Ana3638_22955 [Anaerocolumna sedimenticola]|uniref:Uncharacterized protein n=1 Tax=Anaerocolumna sedimenticola TaxID=2696063 RepID=A0A6P1TTL1_9FIRM|nr:hypothetical protein [Anaerocolumna sedimenticola]QHQ63281.1 hypothetical protein Ana3638_22955 [Anaerocolumna sedimenticola]
MKDMLYQVYCKEQKKVIPVLIPYENDGLGEYIRCDKEECTYKPVNGCKQVKCPADEIFKNAPERIHTL